MTHPGYDENCLIAPPVAKRTAKRVDWLKLTVSSLKDTYSMLDLDYVDSIFIAAHNYQVLSLEHFLNTLLEPNDTISILEGTWLGELYLPGDSDIVTTPLSKEENIDEVYIFSDAEKTNGGTLTGANLNAVLTNVVFNASNNTNQPTTKPGLLEVYTYVVGADTVVVQVYNVYETLTSGLISYANQVIYERRRIGGVWSTWTIINDSAFKDNYIYGDEEFTGQQLDFIVNVSTGDVALEDSIKYWVNYFKPAGKNYIINYY